MPNRPLANQGAPSARGAGVALCRVLEVDLRELLRGADEEILRALGVN
jgi:hypothetical protein